ncbi:MAG: hypothetical protein ABH878_02610 [bacterium]
MKDEELFWQMVDLARRLDYEVRFEKGVFQDGDCRLQDRRIILLNRSSSVAKKINALSRILCKHTLEHVFLLPAIRAAIEKARSESQQSFQENPSNSCEWHHV